MKVGLDVLKKALHAKKHPGIGSRTSLFSMAKQGMPYLTSFKGRANPPLTIYWNVNSVCNLRCKMCDVGMFNEESNFFKNLRIDRKLHEITLEKFCSIVDEVKSFSPIMAINGTEPMMYKPLGDAISYARKSGLDVAVTSGAYNLPLRAEELAHAGLTRLNVSIDGPPSLHNEIRGRKDTFERATQGIVEFKEAASKRGYTPEILINCTVMNLNYAHLVDFYDSVKTLPVDRVNFVNMNFVTEAMAADHNSIWGGKYRATVNCLSEEVQPDFIDIEVLSQQMSAVQEIGGDRICFLPFLDKGELTKFFHSSSEFMGNIPCMSSWFIAQIMADGEVIPYTRCYHVPLGNVNEQSFMDIWNGQKASAWRRELRKQGRFPACARCDMVY